MNNNLDEVVTKMAESYKTIGAINHIDGVNLPGKKSVADITEDLLKVLFPGFFDTRELHHDECLSFISSTLESINTRLLKEISRSLQYKEADGKRHSNLKERAEMVTREFLHELPAIRQRLKLDVAAAFEGDPAAGSFEEIIVAYPFIEAIAVQRMAHVLYLKKIPLIPRIMTEWAHSRTGIDIHPGTRIGTHFFIDHGTGVVIGETAIIGNHVKIYQGVTLGAKSFKRDDDGRIIKGGQRHPTIEDGVTIYAGATILGGETVIGEGSVIGGNVWLVDSLPKNSIVTFDKQEVTIRTKNSPKVDFQI
ncbi:MAG: serine O-acetyltransferase EpsC [Verrucomicrobiota bacterium]|nr:serine O-acetyltransferase EpsC [Verrucomicrobiota bacterium]